MSQIKIIHTTPSEISSIVSESVKKALEDFKKELDNTDTKDQLFTREETCEFLSINTSTLWNYTKKGKLPSKKIGNRVYYLKSEILKALNT
ncbi:helix-turn-helix transcriptional regulator [Winogradskyella tangerina]|uniref:helix-turn-helix transcriptional regulator n=1 Tax=Winogradskyella tangerina TaxID=2023240 RepID=UPI000DBEA115|nr:helix-turn-helix domain-containing protein [Winogradskyella tangerina]